MNWLPFLNPALLLQSIDKARHLARDSFGVYGIYPDSIQILRECCFFLCKTDNGKKLVLYGNINAFSQFGGDETSVDGVDAMICPLTHDNCVALRSVFPFTSPVSHRGKAITIGLGDRLGLASAAHLRLIRDKDLFPVLAQQSIRELNLTGRTYHDVLDAASWAVFQEGYTKGFGADGDHNKTNAEVKMALDCGFTMVTLDCSEHIDNKAAQWEDEAITAQYNTIPAEERLALEAKYLGKDFFLEGGTRIHFEQKAFQRIVLVYWKAIRYSLDVYHTTIKGCGRPVDFEMSIDETLTSTSPESHYFVAAELIEGGVEITSLAPRFCGEFQKGIDYVGDIARFEAEFQQHVDIANHFGYKISVHSGSDKFSVFPAIGRITGGRYHLKTAGTNWMEAVRTIAMRNPSLYRRMHAFAIAHLDEARKYYHVGAKLENVPDIDKLSDLELPDLMMLDDSRQVLHITYGLILQARNPDGSYTFRDELYQTLQHYEDDYDQTLIRHIGKHLMTLRID